MKTLVAAFITALLVFTLATGWMEMVQPRLDLIAAAASLKSNDSAAKSTNKREPRRIASRDDEDSEFASEIEPNATSSGSSVSKVSRENKSNVSKTKAQLLAQLEEVKKHETKLVAREETLRMLYDDIRTELTVIEEIRRRSAFELAQAERKVLNGGLSQSNVATSSRDFARPSNSMSKTQGGANVNAIAVAVQDLSNQGSVGAGATFLRGFNDRDVAKILASLKSRDERLANQLSDQLQAAKQTATRLR